MLRKKDIPNWLTYSRILCVPLLIAAFLTECRWLPLCLFAYAAITDFFDGKLARKWQVESDIGRLLDPNADKLLVAAALIMLCAGSYASPVAVSLIMCRELFVSGLREFMAERNIVVHVSTLAKWKTASQMVAAIVLLVAYAFGSLGVIYDAGCLLLWIATCLTLLTGAQYFWRSLPHLKS